MVDQNRAVCYTLDLEQDYAGVAPVETYETLTDREALERLAAIVRKHGLNLTVFATGRVLEHQRDAVRFFEQLGAEIELHGYGHSMSNPDFVAEVECGVAAYDGFFGKTPLGYRSPGGVTSPLLFETLVKAGIKYDSSLVPSFRWGVYSNLKGSTKLYTHPDSSLVELPIGVVPGVRLPVATSYIRLLGWPTYRLLFRLFGTPVPLIYLFHLVDLTPVPMRKRLSPFLRNAYARGEGKGLDLFEASVEFFKARGYAPAYMSDLYWDYADGRTPQPAILGDR
jgi:hypothetical protein